MKIKNNGSEQVGNDVPFCVKKKEEEEAEKKTEANEIEDGPTREKKHRRIKFHFY